MCAIVSSSVEKPPPRCCSPPDSRLRVSLLNQLHLNYILVYPHNELLSRLYVETTQIRLLEFIMLSTHPHAYL